ncbi:MULTISPECIES: hypothetical protein [unclassified Caballeronia]|uniref:hypothetical protein n=1 Tax=unclassified Caballeronia TaxID=2646786 RepID=UPI002027C97F|nr:MULTISPECIES: hypothetical protein [unclassified Caballeronia]MDR5766725.1 hypothetical protein [Caballeronia sp. LZ028]
MPAEKWKTDPMMDVVDTFELSHSGVFPVALDRRWHCGMHLVPFRGLGQKEPVRAIADGEVVAYRVAKDAISDGQKSADGTEALNSNTGFVLIKHTTETGEGRTITFYSLYMHLLDLVRTNALVPQPNVPAPNSSPNALPSWLLAETNGVQSGGGKRVYRKDQLGFRGYSHGEAHLHFEVFMTEEDFTAYFEQDGHHVALGEAHPTTPASKDYWGSTYFVIPSGSTFVSVPAGLGELETKGRSPKPFFPTLDAGSLDENSTLYVEAYFSRGERFTRAWTAGGDGRPVPLTPNFLQDKFEGYEYALYERATALYGTCPSEGYELLRFGRILSTDTPTLPAAEQATWVAVPFAEGKTGYIDINQAGVQKLSDADFPPFMNWQKIEDGNTPFDENGLCGYDALCQITDSANAQSASVPAAENREPSPASATVPPAFTHDRQVAALVQNDADVRSKLRGFICHAKSEWDASNNDERYGALNEPEGFFGKRKDDDPQGYENFINFGKQFQFMGQTPLGEGKNFWYFHPMAFIRHFRRCGWLSASEFKRIYSDDHYGRNSRPTPEDLRSTYLVPINLATRKFSLVSPLRLAHFLGQGAVESGWLTSMQETSMTGKIEPGIVRGRAKNSKSQLSEVSLGHWYGQVEEEDDPWFRSEKFNSHGGRISSSYDWRNGNCDKVDSQKFRGRGFKQLTGRSNYADYWIFRGWIQRSSFDASWWSDPEFINRNRSATRKIPANIDDPQRIGLPGNCIDSGAFYLTCARPKVVGTIDGDIPTLATDGATKQRERDVSRAVTYAINGGYIDDERRLEYTRLVKGVICD